MKVLKNGNFDDFLTIVCGCDDDDPDPCGDCVISDSCGVCVDD